MFGAFLVLAVALVGGLIAFVGDRVGMRVGRKRLTIFGLRPKYTSILIAILTGVLTAASTLGILSAASENVRIAIFRLDEVLSDLEQTTARNLQLKAEYDRVDASLIQVTKKWRATRTELEGINERIVSLTAERERAERALVTARSELEVTATDLAVVKERYARASTELETAAKEVALSQQRKDNLESAIAILESQIETLSSQREYLGTGVVDFATQPIILHAGEVLAASVVRPGESFAELESLVVDLLNKADGIARARGAQIENKNVGTKVDLKRLTSAYQVLFDLKEPAVLRVVSGTNTIAGKPAFVYPEVLLDEIVFRKGAVIASVTTSGRNTLDEIFGVVLGDLFLDARKKAEASGMINAAGVPPGPEVTFANLQEVGAKAAAGGGRMEIKLVAKRDLRRAGETLSVLAVVEQK